MATTVWKGHLTFGLISLPVKLYRAARAEKVSFRQLHRADHSRVRQTYVRQDLPETPTEPDEDEAMEDGEAELAPPPPPRFQGAAPARTMPAPPPQPAQEPRQAEVSRGDLVKGFEYARDQYVVVTKEELAKITASASREMPILEFVRLADIDPVYLETSYYVAPDRAGERAYALLLQALRQSGFVAVAQLAMHNREHVVVIRPGRSGMILHTMFYEDEIRRQDEYRADTSGVVDKELELATRLIESLQAPFEPAKYKDTYREKLQALIESKLEGRETVEAPAPKPAAVINILDALERSLALSPGRKPPATEEIPQNTKRTQSAAPRKRTGGGRR